MTWVKRGFIYAPTGETPWALHYAAFPTADVRPDGILRVYYSALDHLNDGRTGYVDLNPDNPSEVVACGKKPVLNIGPLGEFDECGATIFGVADVAGKKLAYYQGWQRCEKVPYLIFTGLAVADQQGINFERHSRVPLLDRTDNEPFIRGAPFLMWDEGRLRMWYVSCTEWRQGASGPQYRIVIRTATSFDGINWDVNPHICIAPEGDEYAAGRPCVVRDGSVYKMWFSIRSNSEAYRIGYAESHDGVSWSRTIGHDVIGRSTSGWDSEMICYPYVVDVGDRRFMFYNGNRHGSTGFGYAEYIA